jgi:hypothetical protein
VTTVELFQEENTMSGNRRRLRIASLSLLLVPLFMVVPGMAPQAAAAKSDCGPIRAVKPAAFPHGENVTNTWLPWVPGTQFVLSGTVDGKPHKVVTTVTDLTKVIAGVRTIVVFDQDFDGTVLKEAELQMQAQNKHGAVWNLGEYPEIYENGKLTGAPDTWIHGIAGAHGGIGMRAHPKVGSPIYLQGLVPDIGFEDCATVFQTGQHVCVPTGCYDNVLVTDETAPLDPSGGHHRKYYAPGVGLIRADAINDVTPEVIHLTKYTHLCPAAMTKYRNEALALDDRGYKVSPDVFGKTPHAEKTLEAPPC